MSPEERAEARARLDAATPGSWIAWIEGNTDPQTGETMWGGDPGVIIGDRFAEGMTHDDATFIAHAPTYLRAALDMIDALEAELRVEGTDG